MADLLFHLDWAIEKSVLPVSGGLQEQAAVFIDALKEYQGIKAEITNTPTDTTELDHVRNLLNGNST